MAEDSRTCERGHRHWGEPCEVCEGEKVRLTERRERIATAVLGHLIVAGAAMIKGLTVAEMRQLDARILGEPTESMARGAVKYADALIAEFDK